MPRKPNKALRLAVPLVLLFIGMGIVWAVFNSTRTSSPTPRQPQTAPAPDPQAASEPAAPSTPAPQTTQPAQPTLEPQRLEGIRAEIFDEVAPFGTLGSLDPSTGLLLHVAFSPNGVGIAELRLAEYYETVRRKEHVLLQSERAWPIDAPAYRTAPFSLAQVTISGKTILLMDDAVPPEGPTRYWREVPGGSSQRRAFEAFILDAAGERIARIVREFEVSPTSHELILRQRVENLTDAAFEASIRHYGPVDLPRDRLSYGGDKRRVRFGYLLSPNPSDPSRDRTVLAEEFILGRGDSPILGPKDPATRDHLLVHQIWPNDKSAERGYRLSWVGLTNRYFGISLHPIFDPAAPTPDKTLADVAVLYRVLFTDGVSASDRTMAIFAESAKKTVPPAGAADFALGVYAGPLDRDIISAEPRLKSLSLTRLVVYQFSTIGPCAWCTFAWLASLLLWILDALHFLVHDWALAIILLVVVVRTTLHPVTKWSQVRIQRFSKQMQALAPKQKAIQEKYGNDRKKMQEEMTKLWREEGVNPAGALGCLPMFLQMPVWIALYAMLFFDFNLRHQPAFFGVFQWITGGNWLFLADLAEPDNAIPLGVAFKIPLLSTMLMMGAISSINLLPILLGFVFYVHQKYLTPPSTTLTPEQETQQKVMKVMMVVLFPLLMYAAPSGLAIYFIANSSLAIVESKFIRRHIEKLDAKKAAETPARRKPARGAAGGLVERFRAAYEAQKEAVQKARAAEAKRERQLRPAKEPRDQHRRYKKKR